MRNCLLVMAKDTGHSPVPEILIQDELMAKDTGHSPVPETLALNNIYKNKNNIYN